MGSAENLSANIRRLRKQAGLTQEGLAAKLFISGQAVSKWERGESYPEITMLPALADALNATADELLRAPALTQAEITEITNRVWFDPAQQRPLTPEEIWAELPKLEEAMKKHPEVREFPYTLAQQYTLAADIRWQKGEWASALPLYRKVLELVDAVRYDPNADNPEYSAVENMRVMAFYRLGDEEDRNWLYRTLFRLPPVYYLQSMGMGKDFFFLSQHSILTSFLSMISTLSAMAMRDPAAGKARLYQELPGAEAWALTPEEKLETLDSSVKLLELFGGGNPRGTLFMQLVLIRALVIRMAAAQSRRDRVLSELRALRALCTPERMQEDFAISDVMQKIQFWRLGKPAPDGTPKPETKSAAVTLAEAVEALTEAERKLFYLPISPLPCLKFRYVGEVEVSHLPVGLTALPMLELADACYDFLRDDPEFQDAAAYFGDIMKKAKAGYDPHEAG